MIEKFYSKWLFSKGDGVGVSVEEFEKMVEEAENSPTISFDEFLKEIEDWLKRRRGGFLFVFLFP